jgi:hypothetical protein
MKKHFKTWQKPLVFLSVFVLGAFLLVGVVLAATTNSNNNAPTQIVSLNETDFLVMDFNINVGPDSNIAGTNISAGTAITTTKPASWTDMKFYDYSGGGQWSAGSDWVGRDLDGDGKYTDQSDTVIYAGTWDYGSSLVAGTPLLSIQSSNRICTDSLTNPTCAYFTDSELNCGEDGGNARGHDTNVIFGGSACDADGDVLVTLSANWSFRDGGSGTYESDETLVIERSHRGLTYSASADETIAGSAPSAGTSITATKPASWTTMSFYDASAGGQWNSGNDWIGTDADNNNYYLDRLNSLTAELEGVSTINALTDVTNVKFWLDNGNSTFETGSDTLLGTATTASSYDSGGSGWYVTGLNRAMSGGANRIFVSMTINSAPSNGEIIKVYVPQYVDSGSDYIWQLGDRGMFLNSRVLGNVYNTNSMTVDAIPPTIESINISDVQLKVGDTATVTITFSEPVTGFSNADITSIENASMSPVSSSDGGITWTSTLTPNSLVEDLSNIITVTMSGIYDVPGNPGVGTVNSPNYQIDTVRPTLSSATFSDTKLKIGDSATVTFTFSEAVSGFTSADLTVPNGSVTEPQTANGGLTWTATFIPTADVENLTNVITVDMTGVNDQRLSSDSNTGTGTANSSNYEIDTIRPTLSSATFSDDQLKIGDTATVTFTFSEAVDGLTSSDLTVPNGAVTEPVTGDSGLTWTATFTPSADTEDLENLIVVNMTGVNDKKLVTDSNTGISAANSSNYAIDTVRPTLVSATFSDDQLKVDDTAIVTFTFSEAVSGFTSADLTVPNASVTEPVTGDSGLTWTLTLTPDASVENLFNVIAVNMAGVNDKRLTGDSNTGTGSINSSNYAIDTIRPTLVSATFDDSELKVGDTATVTLTFSEAVSGLSNADLTVGNGTTTEPVTGDGGTVWTLTLTPDVDVEDLTNAITVNMTGVNDKKLTGDSNTGAGTTNSDNYAIDTIRPTLVITMDDDELNIGDTALVTFTFSEKVVGFTSDDITTIQNGTLSALASTNDIVYTATFTPNTPVTDMTNIITVTMSGVNDDFLPTDSNTGEGTVDSPNYEIDTVNATFNMQYYSDSDLSTAIAGDSYLKAGTYYLKITASEALSATPTVNIEAEGSNNDVSDGVTTHISGNDYKYVRIITADSLAIGTTAEVVGISGYDEFNNFSDDFAPLNLAAKQIYTDTTPPVVDAGSDRGTVSATFTQTGSATDTDGSGIASYSWTKQSGHYNPSFGSAGSAETTVTVNGGGPYTIKLTATDNAGNTASDTFTFTWGVVPSSGSVSPGGVGSGASDYSVNNVNVNNNIGHITSQGVNYLSYINSKANFNALVSKSQTTSNHYITINNLDLYKNIIKFTIEPSPQTFELKLNQTVLVDLDGDGIKDIEVMFVNIWVNRAELTIKSLYQPKYEILAPKEEKATSPQSDLDVSVIMKKEKALVSKNNTSLTNRLSGRILLQVEEKGEAWYVEPMSKAKHFMGRPADAFSMMRKFGLGISNSDFAKFEANGAPSKFAGRIFIKVEDAGKAYYINPVDLKMHYLGRPDDAFNIMRELALGISNDNLRQIEVAEIE